MHLHPFVELLASRSVGKHSGSTAYNCCIRKPGPHELSLILCFWYSLIFKYLFIEQKSAESNISGAVRGEGLGGLGLSLACRLGPSATGISVITTGWSVKLHFTTIHGSNCPLCGGANIRVGVGRIDLAASAIQQIRKCIIKWSRY